MKGSKADEVIRRYGAEMSLDSYQTSNDAPVWHQVFLPSCFIPAAECVDERRDVDWHMTLIEMVDLTGK